MKTLILATLISTSAIAGEPVTITRDGVDSKFNHVTNFFANNENDTTQMGNTDGQASGEAKFSLSMSFEGRGNGNMVGGANSSTKTSIKANPETSMDSDLATK